jgi:hypothetical protein
MTKSPSTFRCTRIIRLIFRLLRNNKVQTQFLDGERKQQSLQRVDIQYLMILREILHKIQIILMLTSTITVV